jgi:hypothetical protein
VRVTFTSPSIGGTGAYTFVIGDDSFAPAVKGNAWPLGAGGFCMDGFNPGHTRIVKAYPLYRSAYQLNIPRFNARNRIGFRVGRSFQSAIACEAFMRNHGDLVPAQGELWVQEKVSGAINNNYMPSAAFEGVKFSGHQGAWCVAEYTFWGNGPWQSST